MINYKVVVHAVVFVALGFVLLSQGTASAEDGSVDEKAQLAQDLLNPVADLYNIPIQINFDQNIGPLEDGKRILAYIQPVIPFNLNEEWNLITRTILPVIYQEDFFPGAGSQFGIGDLSMSFFLSPQEPTESGLTWGAGGVFLLPTASEEDFGDIERVLGTEKWSAGPTFVALGQRGPWIYGTLTGHAWSFAGDSDREDVSVTQIYPWFGYTWPTATTLYIQSDMSYDWEAEQWLIPVDVRVQQVFELGSIYASADVGVGYWADSPEFGPEGWRFIFQFTFVIPK